MRYARSIFLLTALGPFFLAWAVTAVMFGAPTASGASFDGSGEGFGEVLLSYSIMFAIATWIGGGFVWLTLRLAKKRSE